MTRVTRAAALAFAALAATTGTAHGANEPRGFSFGVAAGEVTPGSARLWARADLPGRVRLHVTRCRKSRGISRRLRARYRDDLTVQTVVRRLRPDTRYCYRFHMSGRRRSDLGTFRTAPRPDSLRTVRFAMSGDADSEPDPATGRPAYNRFEVYRRMHEERNDFNVNLGDTIYSDSEVIGVWPKVPDALTVAQKWRKYRLNLAMRNLQLMRGGAASYSQWDDHEFINDFTPAEPTYTSGAGGDNNVRTVKIDPGALYRAGVQAFRDYMPVSYGRDGIYRSFRWGRQVQVFMPDERSFRSAKASADHACDNPNSGGADYAPTAEGTLARTEFGLLVSGVRGPVTQRCRDALNDPRRSFLGGHQLARLMREVKESAATWKVILTELPIQMYYILPYDRWEGYVHERVQLLRYLMRNVKNVVFLAADNHSNLAHDVWLHGLENGGPIEESGIYEVTTGPVATRTFKTEINREVGNDAVGPGAALTVFQPPPPQGLGLDCSQIDENSYVEVTATSERLTITPKDIDGGPVNDYNSSRRCGPYTFERK